MLRRTSTTQSKRLEGGVDHCGPRNARLVVANKPLNTQRQAISTRGARAKCAHNHDDEQNMTSFRPASRMDWICCGKRTISIMWTAGQHNAPGAVDGGFSRRTCYSMAVLHHEARRQWSCASSPRRQPQSLSRCRHALCRWSVLNRLRCGAQPHHVFKPSVFRHTSSLRDTVALCEAGTPGSPKLCSNLQNTLGDEVRALHVGVGQLC